MQANLDRKWRAKSSARHRNWYRRILLIQQWSCEMWLNTCPTWFIPEANTLSMDFSTTGTEKTVFEKTEKHKFIDQNWYYVTTSDCRSICTYHQDRGDKCGIKLDVWLEDYRILSTVQIYASILQSLILLNIWNNASEFDEITLNFQSCKWNFNLDLNTCFLRALLWRKKFLVLKI